MDKIRQEELIALANEHLRCIWDGLAEQDERITVEDIQWLRETFAIVICLEEENKELE